MKVIENQSDKPKNVANKHGGAREQSKLIKLYADQWCIDNGYPITKRMMYRGRPIGKEEK